MSASLKEIIEEQTEGDEAFKSEFIRGCKDNYRELLTELERAVSDKDITILDNIIHKLKPLNVILERHAILNDLQSLQNFHADFFLQNEFISNIRNHITELLLELDSLTD